MTSRVVLAGGGTSGHVLPALAIAESLVDLGVPTNDMLYVGATRGIENRLVPESGLRLETLDVTGLQRSFSPKNVLRNLGFLPRLVRARRHARTLLRDFRADVVVSVGGYASLPAVLAARSLGVPIVVVSYDRRPGRSSEISARWATRCAVAFPDSTLPRAVHTGAPVRRAIRLVDRDRDRDRARDRLGVPRESFFVAVMGGSLGSGALNDAVRAFVGEFSSDPRIHVRHVAGERFVDGVRTSMSSLPSDTDRRMGYDVVGYEPDMASVYAAADLLVARGGAGTVAEVAVTGVPAILAPWSGAADDHQTANVAWLADEGAAVLVADDAGPDSLARVMDELRRDPVRRHSLGERAHALGDLNRQGAVARLVLDVAHGVETK